MGTSVLMNRAERVRTRALGGALLALGLLFAAGCGDESGPEQARLLPPADDAIVLVLEAEDGVAEPAMVVEQHAAATWPGAGRQEASGGRCVAVPRDANAADEENPRGTLVLPFQVPADDTYYIHFRVWWRDGCGNSLALSVDGAPPLLLTDSTYERWHWLTLRPDEIGADTPRPFTLTKGEHTLTVLNREDDVKLDQVVVTSDPSSRPAGIMTAPE